MGGSIALTVRFDKKREYRGSCWTNTLPFGMWAPPFYDPATSKRHVSRWLGTLLAHRKRDPVLEKMWGSWNKLAPRGYGLLVVDYVTSTIISAQGYSPPDWMALYKGDRDLEEKWRALKKAKLLGEDMPSWKIAGGMAKRIKLPFRTVICGTEDLIDDRLKRFCDEHLGLAPGEKRAWTQWCKEYES
jgi:hypothetical protein